MTADMIRFMMMTIMMMTVTMMTAIMQTEPMTQWMMRIGKSNEFFAKAQKCRKREKDVFCAAKKNFAGV